MRRWFILALLAFAAPAAAKDCAAIADPMAYNACLASQGPAARKVQVRAAPAAARAAPRGARVVARRGRSQMVFSVRK